MMTPEKVAIAAAFYFGQAFVFWCKLISKNVLEWVLLIMCKEHTLNISANFPSRSHPTLCFRLRREGWQITLWLEVSVKNPVTSFWTLTFSTYKSICLELFQIITSMVWIGVWGLLFQIRSPSYSVLQGPPFSLSMLNMIPWNSPNDKMDEGNIWVGSTIQISRKQNASNRKDFEQISKIKLLWLRMFR